MAIRLSHLIQGMIIIGALASALVRLLGHIRPSHDRLGWERERQMDEETKSKRAAEDNSWYKLATRHGVTAARDDEKAAKDRVTRNRWTARRISDDLRAALLESG